MIRSNSPELTEIHNELSDTFQVVLLLSELFDGEVVADLKLSVGARDGLSILLQEIYKRGWQSLDALSDYAAERAKDASHE